MVNVAVLVSGGGTNLQALIDAERENKLGAGKLVLCVSSNPDAYALARAKKAGIPARVLSPRAFADTEAYADALLALFAQNGSKCSYWRVFLSILPTALSRAAAAHSQRPPVAHPVVLRQGLLRPARARGGARGRRQGDGREVHWWTKRWTAGRSCCKKPSRCGKTTRPRRCSAA